MILEGKLLTVNSVNFTGSDGVPVDFHRCLVQLNSGEVFQIGTRVKPLTEPGKTIKIELSANKDLKPVLRLS